jgi:hypothetical protein
MKTTHSLKLALLGVLGCKSRLLERMRKLEKVRDIFFSLC